MDPYYNYQVNHWLDNNDRQICVLDMADEIARNEKWVGSDALIKEHIDALIGTNVPARGWAWHGLAAPSPLSDFSNRYVEIVYNVENEEDGVTAKRTTKKTIITYALIN